MKNKPMDMVVNFGSMEDVVAWVEHAKSMKFKPASLRLSLQDVVFDLPCEGNAQIDAMVAKAEAAISEAHDTAADKRAPIQLTADAMRQLFGEIHAKRGAAFLREKMCKFGGSRLNDIAECDWAALAEELRRD